MTAATLVIPGSIGEKFDLAHWPLGPGLADVFRKWLDTLPQPHPRPGDQQYCPAPFDRASQPGHSVLLANSSVAHEHSPKRFTQTRTRLRRRRQGDAAASNARARHRPGARDHRRSGGDRSAQRQHPTADRDGGAEGTHQALFAAGQPATQHPRQHGDGKRRGRKAHHVGDE